MISMSYQLAEVWKALLLKYERCPCQEGPTESELPSSFHASKPCDLIAPPVAFRGSSHGLLNKRQKQGGRNHRSRKLSCLVRSSGDRKNSMTRRWPVLISTVTAKTLAQPAVPESVILRIYLSCRGALSKKPWDSVAAKTIDAAAL
jgi:hypothetical protein